MVNFDIVEIFYQLYYVISLSTCSGKFFDRSTQSQQALHEKTLMYAKNKIDAILGIAQKVHFFSHSFIIFYLENQNEFRKKPTISNFEIQSSKYTGL